MGSKIFFVGNNQIKIFQYTHDSGDYVINHSHKNWELNFYTCGKGVSTIGPNIYRHEKDNLVLVEPDCEHDDLCQEKQTVFCFSFQSDAFKESCFIKPKEENAPLIGTLREELTSLEAFAEEMEPSLLEEKTNHILYLLTALQQERIPKQISYQQLTNFIKSYLYHNWNRKPNYVKLSADCGYSFSRLQHIFKEQSGVSIAQYHVELRMAKIKELLIRSNYKINVIAAKCGIPNKSQFSKFFKTYQGISPIEYRRSYFKKISHNIIKHK